LIAAWAFRYFTDLPIWAFLALHYFAWVCVDLDVCASLAGHTVPSTRRWSFLAAWAWRELLALPIWFLAVVGNEVEWRGHRYRVLTNGEVRRIEELSASNERRFMFWRRNDYQRVSDLD